ncbi:hypothetical protein QUA79_25700 [Microcoleus sp. F8-D1]
MNSLLLISPAYGSGFKPILSGNIKSGYILHLRHSQEQARCLFHKE